MRVRKDRGFFYIRQLRKSGSWSLYYEYYQNGLRQKPMLVQKLAYGELGFRSDMSVGEAKERCSRLNKERNLEKSKVRLANRVVELRSMNELMFPSEFVSEFNELLEEENFGSTQHLAKVKVMFKFVQGMVPVLKIVPSNYKENSKRIYKYLVSKKVSIDYGNKIIQMLNRWGKFVAKKQGSYFEPVESPRGVARAAIEEAQLTKKGRNSELGVRTKSGPLTPQLLAQSSDNFANPKHYNWLYISLWFGLRPEEVDALKNGRNWGIEVVTKEGRK